MLDSGHQELQVLQPSSGVIGHRAIHLGHVIVGWITVGSKGYCSIIAVSTDSGVSVYVS